MIVEHFACTFCYYLNILIRICLLYHMVQAKCQRHLRRFSETPGERVVTPPLVFAGAVLFTTFAPSDTAVGAGEADVCFGGGGVPQEGHLYALYYLTGTAYQDAMLGTDNAGRHLISIDLVGDVPSEPAWFLEKIYVQTGGALGRTEYRSPFNPYGGIMLWRGR